MNGHEYAYDVYLSFTGADRDLKNDIYARLRGLGYEPYDSDTYCMGQFRQNYMEALDKSRVYLMILTDNLRNDPAVSGKGMLSEVRKELAVACELEAKNQLNIVILCMSQFFRFADGFHDYNDTIGWLYYTHTRGFSMVYGDLTEGGTLSDRAFDDIASRVATFIEKRAQGTPVISQAPKIEVATENLACREGFFGRERESEQILEAFRSGKQIVVLSGLGGMGKTALATEVAARCHRDGLLRCPQVVHIQELGGGRGALQTIVSSVSYTKGVYDSLAYLGERDKYERKLKALADLPENILLVVDNYNSLRADDLRDILKKLSCKLLITTRVTAIPTTDRIGAVHLGSMDEDTARALFSHRLGKEIAREEFSPLYRFTGGHTITLCMIAKMLAVHGMSIAAMLTALREDGDFGAKVEFRHNEYGDSDTVLGHLGKLYDMSGFGEEERRILRAMSILSDGTIPVSELMRVLDLAYKNEILELSRLGWLEILQGEEELAYLHPILSHMVARLLRPSAETVAPMAEYLLDSVRNLGSTMTYADATVLSERLYYAIHVLGVSDGVLPQALWDAYVAVDSLLGDTDGTRARSTSLAPRLRDKREAALVTSYADMRTLEHDPTRIELLAGYMDELFENAENYKWVMRVLSVTAEFLSGIPGCVDRLGSILDKAVDAAILHRDDFALCDLFAYSEGTPCFRTVTKKIGKYLRLRRREGVFNGALWILSQVYMTVRLANGRRGALDEGLHIVDLFGNGSVFGRIGYSLAHIPTIIKGISLNTKAESLPDSDPLYFYAIGIGAICDRLIGEGALDARRYIELAVNLHIYKTECGHTLASAAKAISATIDSINSLSIPKIKEELAQLCEGDVSEDITVTSLARLQVATIINSYLGDASAVEQSRRVLDAITRIRPEGHADLIYATVNHADNLARFGRGEEALALYSEAYNTLLLHSTKSAPLAGLARKILPLLPRDALSDAALPLYETAICDLDDTLYLFYATLDNYARHVFGALRARAIRADHKAVADVMARLHAATEKRKKLSRSASIQLISTIHLVGVFSTGAENEALWKEACRLLELFAHGTARNIRANAIVQKAELVHGRLGITDNIQEKSEHYLKGIGIFVKYGLQINYASTKLHYLLNAMNASKSTSVDTEAQLKLLGLSGHHYDAVMADLRALKEDLFAPNVKHIDELSPEARERTLSAILMREISLRGEALVKNNYGISLRDYRRMRTAQDFVVAALRAVFLAIRDAYRDTRPPYSAVVKPQA